MSRVFALVLLGLLAACATGRNSPGFWAGVAGNMKEHRQ